MRRWIILAAWLFCPLVSIGCLPPVQETTDLTPSATPEEKEAATTAPAETTDPAAPVEGAKEGFTATASGLKYKIVRPGSGKKPGPSDTVRCHYKGWLDNGKVFDSSYDRGEPAEFPLNGVIAGWTEGLQLVGEGGEIELEIPSDLGYGPAGAPPDIPGGATLHFKVELLKVL
jgi:FKBP-type peptidyl-prolyl cis-trans isomerase FkpA